MEKKIDRRVIKTKKAIRNAFIEIISYKNIDDITIKEIADKADVDRKTIYNYYRGVYDIVDEFISDTIHTFDEILIKVGDTTNILENPMVVFNALNDVLSENYKLYSSIINSTSTKLKDQLTISSKEYAKNQIIKLDLPLKNIKDLDIVVNYHCSGIISIYEEWFKSKSNKSLQEISNIVAKIILPGLHELIKKQ